MADAGTSLDCGDEEQEGEHAAFPGQGLGVEGVMPLRSGWEMCTENRFPNENKQAYDVREVLALVEGGGVGIIRAALTVLSAL